jgi:hypothetical protein
MVPDLLHFNVMHKDKRNKKTNVAGQESGLRKLKCDSDCDGVHRTHTRDETNTTTELGLGDRVCLFLNVQKCADDEGLSKLAMVIYVAF